MTVQVLVLGCGIIGLSTSITLAQRGYSVTIWARDVPPNTTSNKAAAVWYPFLASPPEKVSKWSSETLKHYLDEAVHDPSSGVLKQQTLEVFKEVQKSEPYWKELVPTARRAFKDELGAGYVDGFTVVEGVVVDTDIYLDYLVNKVKKLGIQIIIKEVKDIQETFDKYCIVVNCTGLGSRELLKDDTIFPTRGQTVIVKNKAQQYSIMDDGCAADELVYIVPRTHNTVLGGTAQENDWNTEPNAKDTEDIIRKARLLSPHFGDVEIVQVKVGLRPTRPTIRLEPEYFQYGKDKKLVVHNYGHGGSGYTVAWGCAQEVAAILETHTRRSKL